MSRLRTLEDLGALEGKRVLVRCDFNVPLEEGRIAEDLLVQRVDVVANLFAFVVEKRDKAGR